MKDLPLISNAMKKNSNLSILTKGIFKENPVFVLILGTCPTLATTTNVIGAFGMGLAALAVLVCSNILISMLRSVIPDGVRIPCYITIIAGFVTVVQMTVHAVFPELYEMLGVYLALIVVNCIILGRAEMFAREHTVIESALDGVGMGAGFTLALTAMAVIRELFGKGSIAGVEISFLADHSIDVMTAAPGGFLVFGCLIAVVNKISKGRAIKKKEFNCRVCPAAGFCKSVNSGGCRGTALENTEKSEGTEVKSNV